MLSVREAAVLLGVSDDLVYELTARGELPCLHLGRRRMIPRRAVDLRLEKCVAGGARSVGLQREDEGTRGISGAAQRGTLLAPGPGVP